jgi:hypothetical protein
MTAEPGAVVQELLRRYAAVREIGGRVIAAAELGNVDNLDVLFDERAAELNAIDSLLTQARTVLAGLPAAARAQVLDAARSAQEQERQMRILLASSTHEVPAQLARVRHSLARLSSYGPSQPGRPELIDRRG